MRDAKRNENAYEIVLRLFVYCAKITHVPALIPCFGRASLANCESPKAEFCNLPRECYKGRYAIRWELRIEI